MKQIRHTDPTVRPIQARHLRALLAGTALATCSLAASAQVYRSVGPDGRVTFSDSPAPAATTAQPAAAASTASASAGLPLALRQAMQRYPVTFYTASQCTPCVSGRQLLASRGIPFSEKTVETGADVEALERLTGARDLPVLAVGAQLIKGFSDTDWHQYLDAAGYARDSQLPSSWQQPPASALAPIQPAAPANEASATAEDGTQAAEESTPVAPPTTSTNPAGIRF